MPLVIYYDAPFVLGTQVDQDDFYVGDGVTTDFVLSRKNVTRLGSAVQFDGVQYYAYNGGFTKDSDGFITNSAPPFGSQGVAPGLTALVFDQLFDSTVPGVLSPNIQDIPFYLADPIEIPLYQYHALPGSKGMAISLVDMISSVTASTSWVQLACATADAAGTALTYQATGTVLYTDDMGIAGIMLASSLSGASSMLVDTASAFHVGDYVLINGGQPTQEVAKIVGYSGPTTMRLSGTNFSHYKGETVYTCGRKFWMRCTVPFGAAGGQPQNYYNLSLQTNFAKRSRL